MILQIKIDAIPVNFQELTTRAIEFERSYDAAYLLLASGLRAQLCSLDYSNYQW